MPPVDETYFWDGPLPETDRPSTEPPPWTETKVVGQPIPRVDAYDRVSGSAVYPSDVVLPDMLHVALLTCPHAHALVTKVDTSKAEAMPGVRAVFKDGMPGSEIPWFQSGRFSSRIFDPHCRYEGEEVAAVAADTIYQAWDAVRAIAVEYDVKPNVVDVEDAMKAGAPAVRDEGNVLEPQPTYARGDVAAAFNAPDVVVVEHTFHTPCALHNAIEPHGCVAKWDGPRLTVWESTQGVYGAQRGIADALKMPLSNVRVIGHYVGGGFGAKLSTGKYSIIAALLARKTGRPARLFLTREQVIRSMGNRPPTTITIKAAAKKDGTLVAIQSKVVGTGGAYSSGGTGLADFLARELYTCPNVQCDNQDVYVNAGPERAFRAPGHPQSAWALEIAMDALAEKLRMDPVALRLKNIPTASQAWGNQPYTSTGLAQCLTDGAKAFGWDEARAKKPSPGSHVVRGVGVAAGLWIGGGGNPPATVIVKLFSDGSAHLNMGASDIGCGTKTWGAQIVSEELHVPIDRISIEHADTATTQFATPSGGSKTAPTESPAIRAAAVEVKQQLLQMASDHLKVPAADLEYGNGEVWSKADATRKVAVGRIPAFGRRGLLVGVGYRAPNPEGKVTHPFAVHFAEVDVDTRTGEVRVVRFLAAHDSGRILNPLTFRNQVIGGITMGLGFGTTEERVMDRGQLGKVLTAGLHDYKLPTMLDVPADKTVITVDPQDTFTSTGAKGVGEPAMIPAAPAIANAIFNASGARLVDAPMSPMRVLAALAARTPAPKGQKGRA